jgi:peptidoglycan-associated lipoprotein
MTTKAKLVSKFSLQKRPLYLHNEQHHKMISNNNTQASLQRRSSMFTRALFTTLMVGFLAIGCASKKPQNAQDDAGAMDANGSNAGLTLDLNGDSDSNTAGGLQTVYFDFNASSLNSSTRSALKNNADFLKSNVAVDVQIEGHADERGGHQYNLALGERRAKALRDYLIAAGIQSKRISTISYGKERPAVEGHHEGAWSRNRRGNFVITAK